MKKLYRGLKRAPECKPPREEIDGYREMREVLMMLENGEIDYNLLTEEIISKMLDIYNEWGECGTLEDGLREVAHIKNTLKTLPSKRGEDDVLLF